MFAVVAADVAFHLGGSDMTDYSGRGLAARSAHIVSDVLGTDNNSVAMGNTAIISIHGYADWLEKRAPSMPPFAPMGEANYNYLLKHVYLLPLDAKQVEMLGQSELGRARAMESMLPDPSLADPNPARAKVVPKDQDDFLRAYESREAELN